MKKLIILILSLLLACVMTCALAEEAALTGTWYLVEAHAGETVMNPAAMSMNLTITLNEDGTVQTTTGQGDTTMEKTGVWVLTDDGISVTVEDETEEFAYADGYLTADLGGVMGYFSQEEPVAEEVTLPAAIAAESEEQFLGTWNADSVLLGDTLLPAAAMGETGYYVIEPGKATEYSMEEGQEEPNVSEYTTELQEGALVLSKPNPLYPAFGDEFDTVVCRLYDNGQISLEQSLGESLIVFYLTKAE
jgi:hypothetical protein